MLRNNSSKKEKKHTHTKRTQSGPHKFLTCISIPRGAFVRPCHVRLSKHIQITWWWQLQHDLLAPFPTSWRVAAPPVRDDSKSQHPCLWNPGSMLRLPVAAWHPAGDLTVIGVSQTTAFESINLSCQQPTAFSIISYDDSPDLSSTMLANQKRSFFFVFFSRCGD